MKFKVDFKLIQIDVNSYRAAVDRELLAATKQAANVWLNAFVLDVIPIWSGASRGTFLKLAQSVGFPLAISNIVSPPGYGLGPQLGFQRSEGALKQSGLRYTFIYQTDLFHLVFNEQANASNKEAGRIFSKLKNPGPYNFRKLGETAFNEFAETVRLPSPWNHLKVQRIKK